MGKIIMPGDSHVQDMGTEITITWTQDDVPKDLVEDLEVNSHLFERYTKSVNNAVRRSFNHPDTRPRALTKQILKERVKMAHDALMVMRFEMGMSLVHSLDLLPQKLMEAVVRGERVGDLVEEGRRKRSPQSETWVRETEPRVMTVNTEEDLSESLKGESAPEVSDELKSVAGLSDED